MRTENTQGTKDLGSASNRPWEPDSSTRFEFPKLDSSSHLVSIKKRSGYMYKVTDSLYLNPSTITSLTLLEKQPSRMCGGTLRLSIRKEQGHSWVVSEGEVPDLRVLIGELAQAANEKEVVNEEE